MVRIFLNKFATQSIGIGFYEQNEKLSKKAENRYISMVHYADDSKNIVKPQSFDELIDVLR